MYFRAFAFPLGLQAGQLLQLCTRSSGAQICEAYITGMADSVALTKVFDKNQGDSTAPAGFCIPVSTTGVQMRSAVVARLKSKKDHLHEPVGGLVYTTLHETFPARELRQNRRRAMILHRVV
ncbi:Rap1a/Tai family immunity protein [Entomobacter blattae]|uniref:Rap1a/Tai family immunity protein n=1 Tax=Entomobacter blattae TaxID=2762277 RepID=UPI0023B318D1|nr:Rap1a/Tai family immunity protein [Entomobacter blattae]